MCSKWIQFSVFGLSSLFLCSCQQKDQVVPLETPSSEESESGVVDDRFALEAEPMVSAPGALPYDSRWEHAYFLNFRPAHGFAADVNPPRFSWPYLESIRAEGTTFPSRTMTLPGASLQRAANPGISQFRFQVSSQEDFFELAVDVETEINFYNALAPFDSGKWYWRIGYVDEEEVSWSSVRSFEVAGGTPAWDRSGILNAADNLGQVSFPRLGAAGGRWAELYRTLTEDETGRRWLEVLGRGAADAISQEWWQKALPRTDQFTRDEVVAMTRKERLKYARMGRGIADAALMYKLTGDSRYEKAIPHLLEFSNYESGGLSSPEFHGSSIKFTTEIIKFLAVAYDALYHDLTDEERAKVRRAIEWRVDAVFFDEYTWTRDEAGEVHIMGLAIEGNSHPYQNYCWAMPGILVLAGESEVADRALEIALHYMTGVSSNEGPDEGYNAGHAYGNEKVWAFLEASMYVDRVLPELELGKNPWYTSMGDWFLQMFRLGLKDWPFGDQHGDWKHLQRTQMANMFKLWRLTEEPRFAERFLALREFRLNRYRPIYAAYDDLPGFLHFPPITSVATKALERDVYEYEVGSREIDYGLSHADESDSELFASAGWVMAGNAKPSDWRNFDQSVGMIFQCRAKGFTTHSYRAENNFMWFAHGEVLSAGGGLRKYQSDYSRSTISHNAILVNGIGQEYEPHTVPSSVIGRILAYGDQGDYIHWVGDATGAYSASVPDIERAFRHLVFVKEPGWFVIYDDLALREGSEPATWSWLFKVKPDCPLEVHGAGGLAGFSYQINEVNAQVVFANAQESLKVVNRAGIEGYKNPHTGYDYLPGDLKEIEKQYRQQNSAHHNFGNRALAGPVKHNLWVENVDPRLEQYFMSALIAWNKQGPAPLVESPHRKAIRIAFSGTEPVTVSFDPNDAADIVIDPQIYRDYADVTMPPKWVKPEVVQAPVDPALLNLK